jgi:hypothetical protein
MATLYVSDIKFLNRAECKLEGFPKDQISKVYTFLITSAVPTLPPDSYKAKITDLSALAERYILFHLVDEMSRPDKKLLVIDLSNYPYVTSYVDYRDQESQFSGDNSTFAKNVLGGWNRQDLGPTIVVNTNIPHTGLKFTGTGSSKF